MRETTTQLTTLSYSLTISETLLAGQTLTGFQGCTVRVNGLIPALPYLLKVDDLLAVTHTAGDTVLSGLELLAAAGAGTEPGSIPDVDSSQWTYSDDFGRSFLGTDYETATSALPAISISSGGLLLGNRVALVLTNGQGENQREYARARLQASLWNSSDVQIQYDARFGVAQGGSAPFLPLVGVRLVGAQKSLDWDGVDLYWGGVKLAGSGTAMAADVDYRFRVSVDQTAGRIQISRDQDGLIDVALPADWAAGMGGQGLVELFHQSSRQTTNGIGGGVYTSATFDNLAVRSGDGSAQTGGGTSGGSVRIGAVWRFSEGLPDDTLGQDGDVWAVTTSGALFQRISGAYQAAGNLRGPRGLPGEPGEPGEPGTVDLSPVYEQLSGLNLRVNELEAAPASGGPVTADDLPGFTDAGTNTRPVKTAGGTLEWTEDPATSGGLPTASPAAHLIAIGDSTTYGDQAGGPGSAWPGLLAGLRNWTVVNAGVNGSTLSTGGGNPMVGRYAAAIPSDFDGHVLLMGGTNDWGQSLPLGQAGSADTGTIYGALRALVSGIMGRLDSSGTLTLLTPAWRADEASRKGNGPAYTLEQVRQAVRDEAARGARLFPGRVQLFDLGRDLRDWFADASGVYINADNLHPTAAGHVLIAQYLAAHESGDSGSSAPAPALLYSRTFGSLAPGNLNGRDDWAVYGGSAVVSSDGLTINASYDSQPRGLLHPLPVGASRSLVRAQFGGLPAGQGIIHRAAHRLSDDRSICVWANADGAGVVRMDAGIIQGGAVTSWLAGTGPVLAADSWLELLRAGGQIELRAWEGSGARPSAPMYTHADDGMVGDALGLSTIGAAARVVTDLLVY